jgi:hypothetical protein
MQMIETAALWGDTLWLLYSTGPLRPSGSLFSLDLETRQRTGIRIPTTGTIEQFAVLPNGATLVASSDRVLWQYSSGKLEFLSTLPESPMQELLNKYGLDNRSTLKNTWESGMVKGKGCPLYHDRILNMFANDREILLLTSASMLRYDCISDNWKVLALPNLIPKAFRMPAVFSGDGYLYQGTCLGEDGGDLKRINTKTGAIDILYEGHQVTSVVRDPWDPDTTLFSTGTWHMGLDRGGIYHAGEDLEPFFSDKAVFSMKTDKDSIIAASSDGVYRILHERIFERYDYPDHVLYDGVGVVTDERFGAFVETDIYRSNMVCGPSPLFPENQRYD